MYSLSDAEYMYNPKTKQAMPLKQYTSLLEQAAKGVTNIDAIKAIQQRLGFDFCYKMQNGEFVKAGSDIKLDGIEESSANGLTAAENKVALLVKQAKRNKEIADTLGIGEGTVRTHLRSIFAKLNIKSRAELIVKEL